MNLRQLNNKITLSVILFFISKFIVLSVMYGFGCRKLWEGSFTRWDSGLYISIAQEGHTLFDCNYPNNPQWCGNAGWSPLYPALIRIVHELSRYSFEHCGGIVTMIFFFLYILYLTKLFDYEKISSESLITLLLCVFFPGFIYLHAVFPLSLCLFLITAIIYYL